jgi:uncharacterized OB-fold protein
MTELHGFVPPVIDPDATEFWDAVAAQRLLVPMCRNCGRAFLPPLPCCPNCQSTDIELREASGTATLYSWIVVHRALDPVFADAVPYVVAAVQLAEGARLYSRLVDIDGVDLRDGLPLELTWIEPEGKPMWAFRPRGGA